jgi:hypothetical protein
MSIDPLIMLVVDVLGKYVIDKGATLLKEAGQAAVQAAAQLFQQVMNRLKADPAEAKNVERFEKNPRDYQAAIAEALAEKMKNDPEFASQIAALLDDYKKAVHSVDTSSIKVGSGAIAMQGGIAAGEGGVAVDGNVQGGITLNNTVSQFALKGDDP